MNDICKTMVSPIFGAIRISGTKEKPMFCLSDVCRALDIKNSRDCKTRLYQDGVVLTDGVSETTNQYGVTTSQKVQLTYINEANFYKCVFMSRKSNAEEFQKWVFDEVLPSIRKDGGYMVAKDNESEEDLMARALVVAQATLKRREERIKQLEQKSKDDEPYTVFGRAMTIAKEGCLLGEFAKILTQNGIKIGQNNLFRWMRDNNYLCKTGEKWNLPLQRYTEQELFVVKPDYRKGKDGELIQVFTTKITGKGQMYFINKFLENPDLLDGYYNGNKKK